MKSTLRGVFFCPLISNKSSTMEQIKIIGLERHAYAPELNKLVYSNGRCDNAPCCFTLSEAMDFVKQSYQKHGYKCPF